MLEPLPKYTLEFLAFIQSCRIIFECALLGQTLQEFEGNDQPGIFDIDSIDAFIKQQQPIVVQMFKRLIAIEVP